MWAALDLGLKHDATALMVCAWDGDRVRLVTHQVFVPRTGETIDVESVVEAAILGLRSRFSLQALYYDPWQAIGLAQRLVRAGVTATEYPQTLPNLGLMANNPIDLSEQKRSCSIPMTSSEPQQQKPSRSIKPRNEARKS